MTTDRTWMGRVFIGVSLDGMIARRGGDIGWLTDQPAGRDHVPGREGPDAPAGYEDFMAGIDHIVMGRGTYDKVLTFGFWPYESKQVIVVSTTLTEVEVEGVQLAGSVGQACGLLDAQDAGGVYVDGGQLIQESLRRDLIDELTISVAPVLIGDGLPLFGSLPGDILLTHVGTSYNDHGMTSSRYLVQR